MKNVDRVLVSVADETFEPSGRVPIVMELACSLRSRLKGLVGRCEFNGTLLLAPCNDIHTFTMKRSIDVAFVSSDGLIVEVRKNVPPRRRLRNRRAVATLERYASSDAWYVPGDRLTLCITPPYLPEGRPL